MEFRKASPLSAPAALLEEWHHRPRVLERLTDPSLTQCTLNPDCQGN